MSEIPERLFIYAWQVEGYELPEEKAANQHEYHLAPRWVSVEDGLPENNIHVLLLTDQTVTIKGYRLNDAWMVDFPNEYLGDYNKYISDIVRLAMDVCPVDGVTHWMPLPAPPEDE